MERHLRHSQTQDVSRLLLGDASKQRVAAESRTMLLERENIRLCTKQMASNLSTL